ncbi:4,5-DOPA-extradiol-dioxygenase [Lonsdalea populi]|uniref:4,5-DOPA-extradiol-dioxygenase n=1 Tax=Lonsdalea populi TaxID=1172565 RepID=UPI000A259043|nr:4,5-DOPA dioxygenase extradiol [Lonsdalea populi]OSM97455.1 dioxygenase [Lonsdalea populi]RAT72968.1 dioxygenase [Lonsdalea populi]RAT74192.1 dioxygenase [Lonsdalea populi]RAT77737.1 dioxygenase [Lonsdalea populi]RAT78327.1 dioxygenase [Lonsdalea populi]
MNVSRMPALFLGHGSPMNVLEDNIYTATWRKLGEALPRPKAIVAVSAHWFTRGTAVTAMNAPRTIHDFGGFPQALFDTQYPAPGSPALARQIQQLLAPVQVHLDEREWGLDHGSWGVLIKVFPQADIPVVQLSVDGTQPAEYHYQLGRRLSALRDQGVMMVASGNVVHNLLQVKWEGDMTPYPWASVFNRFVRDNLTYSGDKHPLVNFMQHPDAAMANPSPDHFLPLLYVLGCRRDKEPVSILVDGIEMGSLSMLSVQVG